jgi:uncharacterized RDD family membrane protein YckC
MTEAVLPELETGASANPSDHRIVTPEGVPLLTELAPRSERAAAFLIDFILCILAVFLVVLPITYLTALDVSVEIVTGIILFVNFIIRNTYFLHFELAWRGATPGKRILGLRVIDRNGGPLLPGSVIARNLTREFEIFMPFAVLMSLPGAQMEFWAQWLSGAWLLVIGLIPFLNRDRMRGGDLIAGTIVISMHKQALLDDQVKDESHFRFTDQQLAAYGNYELQVLEQVLRSSSNAHYSGKALEQVGNKIRNRIGWQGTIPASMEVRFLRDFYTAQRAFLERSQLFGKTRPDKTASAKSSLR